MLKINEVCLIFVLFWFYFNVDAYMEINLRQGRPLLNDTSFVDFNRLRIKKINRTTHVFLGDASSFVDIGNDYTIEGNSYKKQGNEYRKMPYNIQKVKFCNFIQNEKFFYDELLLVSDLPAKGVCPWPKGNYTVVGAAFTFSTFPIFFDGDYLIEGVFKKGEVIMNGYQIYLNVVKVT